MALSDDYVLLFDGTQTTFVDADWTDIKSNFQKVAGNLHPVTAGVLAKMVCDGVTVNPSGDTVSIKVVVGVGYDEYHSTMGPAWIVPDTHADKGKGYWLRHNGNNIYLHQMDTETGEGSSILSFGAETWQLGDVLEMEIYDIVTTPPKIRCKRNGTQLGAAATVTDYIDDGIPGIVADPLNKNTTRGVTEFGFTGTSAGGFSVDDVNGDNVIDHSATWDINGRFDAVTISTVTLKQGAESEAITFNETDTALECDTLNMHTTTLVDGAATVEVYDGTETKSLGVVLDASGTFDVVTATAIGAYGLLKDVTTPAVGDVCHFPATIGGQAAALRSDGPHFSISPPCADGSTATAWHFSAATPAWTQIDMEINPTAAQGPIWSIPYAWALVEGVSDTYPLSDFVTASAGGGTVGSYALNPTVTGFSMNSGSGQITFDGTLPAGNLWLTGEAADTNGTTTAPDIAVTIAVNPLGLVDVSVGSIATQTATMTVTAKAAVGTIYASVTLLAADCDTAAEIITPSAETWADSDAADLSVTFFITGLDPDTIYYFGVVQNYSGEDSAVITDTFTTQAEITFTDEGKAPVTRP